MTNKELFETYRSDVYRTCYYMLGQASDAEDICQEVFMTAFRGDWQKIDNVRTWLLRIAVNRSLNLLKRRNNLRAKLKHYPHLLAGRPDTTPDIRAEDRESAEEWAGYVGRLPLKIRAVISLRYVHDLGTAEIADLLNIPQGTVKSRQHKGLRLLKAMLEREGKSESIKGGAYHEYQSYKG
ncbi:RNA polymerase sigma factor [Saccharibacillus alkalitolerans]|uniref:RNA polymerase sigma factor n=1 Tax=Saccharibacillus alkalitolerans TaxID=2705290 RepID=A0ABX0F424_9BACL|nr:RNA polymerase sigma factor [Saccharibacillus alkalitolerans]NGZ73946.1 RNA polymerase sigma factor [Saccharibacillus alkalitolerans]